MTNQEFIEMIAGYVCKYAPQYNILVNSPVIAQAILESGWGKSTLASKYNNYFGLKCGSSWTGRSVNMATKEEYAAGTLTDICDNFRVFDTVEEGVKGYFEFLQYTRYANLKGITNPRTYLETIKADGYATSSTYVENCMSLVNQLNLKCYDNAGSSDVVTSEESRMIKTIDELAKEVIQGKWGNGADRKAALEAAGYDYAEVQKKVNELLGVCTAKITVGSIVKLKHGAKTYDGKGLASFVYERNHEVKEVSNDRAVIAYQDTVVAAVKISDLTLV